MTILSQRDWRRLVLLENNTFSIQIKVLFKWRTVSFGPYYPRRPGYDSFDNYWIALQLYGLISRNKKSFAKNGI